MSTALTACHLPLPCQDSAPTANAHEPHRVPISVAADAEQRLRSAVHCCPGTKPEALGSKIKLGICWTFLRMRSKGSRFTLGVWDGLGVEDVFARRCATQPFATVRTRSHPFPTVRNRSQPFAPVRTRSQPFATVRTRSHRFATVRNRSQPFATVCNRSQPFATVRNRSHPFAPVRNRSQPFAAVRTRSHPFATVRNRSQPFATVRNRSHPFAPVRNRSQPFATVRNRSQVSVCARYGNAYGECCKSVTFEPRFMWQAWHFVTSRHDATCFITCQKPFRVTGANLLCRYQKMSCIFRGRRSTLETSIIILRGERSTLEQSSFAWQAQHFRRVALRVFCKLHPVVTTCKSRGRCGTS